MSSLPPLVRLPDPTPEQMAGWPKRADGSSKGLGYFGLVGRPDGDYSSELSVGVNLGGKEVEIPSMVPTLTHQELQHLIHGGEPTTAIVDKAVAHARQRMKAGLSPFADNTESLHPIPPPAPMLPMSEILR